MPNLSFITDETHNCRYVQIDLAEVAEIDDEQLGEIMDIIIADARKVDEKITFEDLQSQLNAEGRL